MATLSELTAVRSQLADGLRAYLRHLKDLTAWPVPPFINDPTRLFTLYQPPHVIRRDPAKGTTRPAKSAPEEEEEQEESVEIEWDEPERGAWFHVWPTLRRGVVLGLPGQGKSLLTQMTAAEIARASFDELEGQTRLLTDLVIPIWLRVEHVMNAGSLQKAVDTHTRETVVAALRREFPNPGARPSVEPVMRHLQGALERDTTFLFLDAFDEAEWDATVFHRDLAALRCRVLFTGRPHAYEPSRFAFTVTTEATRRGASPTSLVEYDLAALTVEQRDTFIAYWFASSSAPAVARERIERLVRRDRRFGGMTRNAQLLTLVCATGERHPFDERTRRVHLFDWAVRDIVGRIHKPKIRSDVTDAADVLTVEEVDQRLRVLPRVAGVLFDRYRDGVFTNREWEDELLSACVDARAPDDATFRQRVSADLREGGLIVRPQTGHAKFLHRSFHEYLTAVMWVEGGSDALSQAIVAHLGDPHWNEVIRMAVGYLGLIQRRGQPEDASRVVERVIRDAPLKPSLEPGSALIFMGETLAEVVPGGVTDACRRRVTEALMRAMASGASARWFGSSHISARIKRRIPILRKRVESPQRADCGDALAELGDPRFLGDAWWLPANEMLGFVAIPAGAAAGTRERTAQPAYYIGQWPVTVAQFRAFIDATKYRQSTNRQIIWRFRPSLDGVANHPVVNLSYRDALEYCNWLTDQLTNSQRTPRALKAALSRRWRAMLPNEKEWKKAIGLNDEVWVTKKQGQYFRDGKGTVQLGWGYYSTSGWPYIIGAPPEVRTFAVGFPARDVPHLGSVMEWTRTVLPDPEERTESVRRIVQLFPGSLHCEQGKMPDSYHGSSLGFRVVLAPDSSDPSDD